VVANGVANLIVKEGSTTHSEVPANNVTNASFIIQHAGAQRHPEESNPKSTSGKWTRYSVKNREELQDRLPSPTPPLEDEYMLNGKRFRTPSLSDCFG
jgi:hypothetical protein